MLFSRHIFVIFAGASNYSSYIFNIAVICKIKRLWGCTFS